MNYDNNNRVHINISINMYKRSSQPLLITTTGNWILGIIITSRAKKIVETFRGCEFGAICKILKKLFYINNNKTDSRQSLQFKGKTKNLVEFLAHPWNNGSKTGSP